MSTLKIKGVPVNCLRVLHGGSPAEKFAASEIESYLTQLCDVKTADGGAVVEIRECPCGNEHLTRDSYAVTVEENRVLIEGGNGRGVIYGVYALLEKYAGARFYMPGLEVFAQTDVDIADSFAFTPPFEFRQSDWPCGADVDWSVKNAVNSRAIPNERGGYQKYGLFVHTMTALTGTAPDKQPCLSDPAVLEMAKKKVREILAADPEITIISVSQNDNGNYCKCEKCAAVDEAEGSHMGTLLRFVNAVADGIKDDYPSVAVDTLAYQYTRAVPKLTKPHDNVIIRLCSIECCFSHPLDDPTCSVNAAFKKDIENWNEICDRIYIWDYVTDFSYYIPTFPNFGVLRENMRFFADHGVRGMYPEGNYNSEYSGEFGELRAYLLAKLMCDPHMSAAEYYAYMDGFLAAYYGEGWRYIRAYIDLTCAMAYNNHMSIWINPLSLIPRESYAALESTFENWWNAAEAAAGERIGYVKRSRLQWRYIKQMLHPEAESGRRLFEDVEAAHIRWNEWRNFKQAPDFTLPPDKWE